MRLATAILSTSALIAAQTSSFSQTAVQWGVNRTATPPSACLYDNTNTCQPTFTLPQPSGGIGAPVIYADAQAGVDWCAKVMTAAGLLPSTGGVVDARGLTGAQACASGVTNSTNGITVLFGAMTLTVSNPLIFSGNAVSLICPATGTSIGVPTQPTQIQMAPGANLPIMVSLTGAKNRVSDCTFDGNKANETAGTGVLQIGKSNYILENVTVQNGYQDGFRIVSSGSNNTGNDGKIVNSMFTLNGGRGIFCFGVADTMVTGTYFEQNGAANLELDNCPTWRVEQFDFGGAGANSLNGLAGVASATYAPQVYIHGQPFTAGQYLAAVGEIFGHGQFGNGHAQDILIDGSAPGAIATIGGSVTPGDTITLTLTGTYLNGGSPVNVSYVAQSGDTTGTVACELVFGNSTCTGTPTGGIRGNATLTGFEIGANVSGSAITVHIPALLANVAVAGAAPTAAGAALTGSVSGGATETVVISGVSSNSYGVATYRNQISGPYFNGTANTSSVYYPVEVYNAGNTAASNNLGPFTINSNSNYYGIALIHGTVGYDSVHDVTAYNAFGGGTSWSNLLSVGATTNIQNVCASSMSGCFNNAQTWTSSANSTFAGIFTTLGLSNADQKGVKLTNPSAAGYAAIEQDFCAGTQCAEIYGQRENTANQVRLWFESPNSSNVETPLQVLEAAPVSLGGCSFATATASKPHGTAALSANCSNQNITVTFGITTNGWVCGPMVDRATGLAYYQISDSGTTAVYKGVSGSNGDVMQWGPCNPY